MYVECILICKIYTCTYVCVCVCYVCSMYVVLANRSVPFPHLQMYYWWIWFVFSHTVTHKQWKRTSIDDLIGWKHKFTNGCVLNAARTLNILSMERTIYLSVNWKRFDKRPFNAWAWFCGLFWFCDRCNSLSEFIFFFGSIVSTFSILIFGLFFFFLFHSCRCQNGKTFIRSIIIESICAQLFFCRWLLVFNNHLHLTLKLGTVYHQWLTNQITMVFIHKKALPVSNWIPIYKYIYIEEMSFR